MIKRKNTKNAPHFTKQRIDLWALKKQVEEQQKENAYLLRRIEQLSNFFQVIDEEVADLRTVVMEPKRSLWQRFLGWLRR
ncbi:hypothetical protein [Lonepinella sp. BR2919]|uniref:hypothetical protein n=1 Tax=unclassified Lonepinella TaxID=2642006 RepID=UPI003F6DEA45